MNGGNGAHFLIDKQGVIYQTAQLDKKTYHVGKVRSKCYETSVCSKSQLQTVNLILSCPGKSYPNRVRDLHKHEKTKKYPDRYPLNEDSRDLGDGGFGGFGDVVDWVDLGTLLTALTK